MYQDTAATIEWQDGEQATCGKKAGAGERRGVGSGAKRRAKRGDVYKRQEQPLVEVRGVAGEVPQEYRAISEGDDLRAVTDFIAGMTDRYAKNLYQRLFIPHALHY